jgi:protein TonB
MFIIIISTVALAVFLFTMDYSWSNVLSADRNDLVFEGRNQQYGAYRIRQEHHKTMLLAILLSTGLIAGGMTLAGKWMNSGKSTLIKPKQETISILVTLDDEKPIEKTLPKEDKPAETRTAAGSSDESNREVEVIEGKKTDEKKSDDDLKNKPIGDGDEHNGGPIAPGFESGTGGDGDKETKKEKKEPRKFVKNKPQFPGGDEELMKYMLSKVRFGEMDIEQQVGGTIYLSFVVDSDGSIRDVAIVRNIPNGDRMGRQAIKAIESMPLWEPGNDGAEPLPVLMTLPLRVELRN